MAVTNIALVHVRGEALRRAVRPLWPARWGVWLGVLGVAATATLRSPTLPHGAALLTCALLILYSVVRKERAQDVEVPRNILLTLIFLFVGALLTGGISSPFLYGAPMMTVIVFTVVSRPVAWLALLLEVAAVWAFAIFGFRSFSVPLIRFPAAESTTLIDPASPVVLSLILGAAARIGRVLDTTLDGLFREVISAREDALAAHQQQIEDLTTLSGEIAHELKNPLTSVKGLAALVARDLTGKSEERMGVLRREVERVLSSLEELLSLTKPLLPLSIVMVDLRRLCQEIIQLHEGMAAEGGATLTLSGQASAACDRRKVKQILTNLIQNAIEVAPLNSTVSIQLTVTEDSVCAAVGDRGPGLPEELSGHMFRRGATTKPKGSGTGLTVARTLARQHGGDLTLVNREGGGALARFTLPSLHNATSITGAST